MAPPKATAWPESIYEDPDVLTLDEAGRFIICGVCADSYAMRRGKKPKPVIMNACFRTRAWDTHKVRTRAHRLPKIRTTRTTPGDNSSQRNEPAELSRSLALVQPQEAPAFVLPRLESITSAPIRAASIIPTIREHTSNYGHELPSPLVFPLSRVRGEQVCSTLRAPSLRNHQRMPATDERPSSSIFHIRGLLNPHHESARPLAHDSDSQALAPVADLQIRLPDRSVGVASRYGSEPLVEGEDVYQRAIETDWLSRLNPSRLGPAAGMNTFMCQN